LNSSRLTIKEYEDGILTSNRIILGQAITLIESNLSADQQLANDLIERIINKTGQSIRIGITGVPGVGKSTFIETFGKHLTDLDKKVAVLTVDPSSQLTKGSILGDKTRMEKLAKNNRAFIRPSASGSTLGGVTTKTRETILLCEAAGYDVIIIETVGVGQSEVSVKGMSDFFLLLMLAGAGDELQGIKKGIVEMADAIVITKADGDNLKHASEAQAEYQHALHLLSATASNWQPQVLISSAETGMGIKEVWQTIDKYRDQTQASGYFEASRQKQNISWLKEHFDHLLRFDFSSFKNLNTTLQSIEHDVSIQKVSPHRGAQLLLEAYHDAISNNRAQV
jgi:LAO/AO transport system kinase